MSEGPLSPWPPVADQILEAGSPAARAAIVLRISDAVLLEDSTPLLVACSATGFELGRNYLTTRLAALCAVRTESGRLPDEISQRLETWRQSLFWLASSTDAAASVGGAG